MTAERFVVTGGAGCVGAWVVRNLVDAGHAVAVFDLDPRSPRLFSILGDERLARVELVAGDISAPGDFADAIKGHEATRVVHLAGLQIPLVRANPSRGASVNVVGTVNVFEAVRRTNGRVRGLVYASSTAAYDDDGDLRDPGTLYGVFKRSNEGTARIYAQEHGVNAVGLRPCVVYGPGRDQGLTSALTLAVKAAVLGVPYEVPFGGTVDLQYASDVADAFIQSTFATPTGAPVFDLHGEALDVDAFLAALAQAIPGAQTLISHGDGRIPGQTQFDDGPLRALVGEIPRTPLADALRASIEFFERERDAGRLTAEDLA